MPIFHYKKNAPIDGAMRPTGAVMPSGASFFAPLDTAAETAETGQSLTVVGDGAEYTEDGYLRISNGTYIQIGGSFDFRNAWSFVTNFRFSSGNGESGLFGTTSGGGNMRLVIFDNGAIETTVSGSSDGRTTTDANYADGVNHTLVWLGSGGNYVALYIDGELVTTTDYYNPQELSNVIIGSSYASGTIDQKYMRFYDRVLSAEEIATLSAELAPSQVFPTSSGFDDMGFAVPYDMASDAECSLVVASNVIVTPYDATQDVYGDWIISSLTVLNSTHRPWRAFGDPEISAGHEWHSGWRGSLSYDNPEWIQWQNLKYLIKIKEYTIINRTADCGILDWELQGSNDGNTWTTLDKVSRNTAPQGEALTRQVSQDKQGEYSYHRIFITKADTSYAAIGYITATGDLTKELAI